MTVDEMKSLQYGDHILYDGIDQRTGKPKTFRLKVNGKPKTWKRQPEKVQVPVKWGLYTYDYMTEVQAAQCSKA